MRWAELILRICASGSWRRLNRERAPYAAAGIFQVSVSYIYKALGRRRRTGETSAKPHAGGQKPKLAAHDEALRGRVLSEPDATLAELQAWLVEERGVKVCVGCLWKRLRRLGLTLKKSVEVSI